MKKVVLLLALVISNLSFSQANEPNRVILEPYVGIPFLEIAGLNIRYETNYNLPDSISPKKRTTQTPYIGFRTEYRLNALLGFGVDLRYHQASYQARYQGEDNQIYDLNMKKTKFGVMPTLTFHFLKNDDNLDIYFLLGAGYRGKKVIESSNEVNFNPGTSISEDIYFPLSGRVSFGLRAYFRPNAAFHVNFGAGQGGVINGGFLFRI
jgi:hypothetical protein